MILSKKDLLVVAGAGGLVALLPAVLPRVGSSVPVGTEIMIWGIFAMGYNVLLGGTGILSFGHAAFFGLSGYATGLLLLRAKIPLPLALPAAVAASLAASVPVGALIIRKRGIYFAMLTIAFGQMFYFIASQWNSLTGGLDGLTGFERSVFFGLDIRPERNFFYFVLAFFVATLLVIRGLMNSAIGKTLVAIRENVHRAEFLGVDVKRYRHFAFVVSATFSGLAGALYVLLLNFAFPELLYWKTSGDVVLMSVIGGMRAFFGPLVGAGVFVFLRDIISTKTIHWALPLGAIFVTFVIFFQKGIMGFFERGNGK
ncbi:MAG: branched-chain amino acid ABC transporter permease [Deltaproteobacteria bacterium]|nr:branched-chain amino acid ABC transporter permease [Deltaproteobacteria bacterium]